MKVFLDTNMVTGGQARCEVPKTREQTPVR